MNAPLFVLASASPARLALLRGAGLDPHVMVSGVDESVVQASDVATLCLALARLKAEAVVDRLATHPARPGEANDSEPGAAGGGGSTLVLGCDSLLEFEGEPLGKPDGPAEAAQRWRRLRGRTGTLHTGHCLVEAGTGRRAAAGAATEVHFADLTDDELAAYIATGEPLAVAGGFTIDGRGGWFIDRIEGDHGTVVGLSLPLLRRLLADLGISVTDLWTPNSERR